MSVILPEEFLYTPVFNVYALMFNVYCISWIFEKLRIWRCCVVTKNIELLRYRRQITRLLETLEQHKAAISDGETGDLPPLLQPPPLPALAEYTRTAKISIFGFPMKEEKVLYSTGFN